MACKVIHITSRKKRENHMLIVMNLSNEMTARGFIQEIKKMARKKNHLFEKNFSYEVYVTIREKTSSVV